MCDKALRDDYSSLQYVLDWFVTQGQVKMLDDDDDYCNDDGLIKWYNGYKKREVQKAKIEEESMRIASHPLRRWKWCMLED